MRPWSRHKADAGFPAAFSAKASDMLVFLGRERVESSEIVIRRLRLEHSYYSWDVYTQNQRATVTAMSLAFNDIARYRDSVTQKGAE